MQMQSAVKKKFGWGGGIRTPEWQDQNLLPYRLATPQQKCDYSQKKLIVNKFEL